MLRREIVRLAKAIKADEFSHRDFMDEVVAASAAAAEAKAANKLDLKMITDGGALFEETFEQLHAMRADDAGLEVMATAAPRED